MSFFFKPKNRLRDDEVRMLLVKIRSEYAKQAQEHGTHRFNVEGFNERYQNALRSNTEIETFLLAEVQALEEMKQEIREQEEARVREREEERMRYENSFSKKADDMLKEFERMIEKYPARSIDENASNELNRLYGGMTEMFGCFSLVRNMFLRSDSYEVELLVKEIDETFYDMFVTEVEGKPPDVFQDYLIALRRGDAGEAERREKVVLKEAGLFLNDLVKNLATLEERLHLIDENESVICDDNFTRAYPRIGSAFSGKTKKQVLLGTKNYAQALVRDFRLKGFKRKKK